MTENCLTDLHPWFAQNVLQLNDDKTIFMLIGSKFKLLHEIPYIQVGEVEITPSAKATNLGVTFDEHMTTEQHVGKVTGQAFHQIRELGSIMKVLNVESTKILVHGFISSHLDYCNALLFGLPHYLLQRLQYIQNAAARLIAQKRKYDHVTQIRKALHWLPIKHRIGFKVILHAYKAQHNLSTVYLSELITPHRPTRRLISSCDEYRLVEHRTNIKHYGDCAFQNAAPKLWNELPMFIHQCESLAKFKHHLKTFLFKKEYL